LRRGYDPRRDIAAAPLPAHRRSPVAPLQEQLQAVGLYLADPPKFRSRRPSQSIEEGKDASMTLANHWISVAYRGLLAVAFAALLLFRPEKSLTWFAPLMLFYAMADGVLAIAAAARAGYAHERWACSLLEGLAGLSGIVTLAFWPEAKFPVVTWTLAGWATITAIAAIVASANLGRLVTRDWLLAAAGVVLVRSAVLTLGATRAAESALALWSGANALLFAALFFVRILRLRVSGSRAVVRLQLFAR
jgi:uncharacterized membrane protein HdeD (DUF308 family)